MATPCSVAARFSDDILLFLSSAHPLSGRGAQASAPRVFIPARCWDISLVEMISLLYFYRHYYPTYRIIISWYKPVNFAVSISEVYRLVEKQYRNAATPDANTLAVLANGRYFFVAYVVNALNHAGKPLTAERSFANFDYSADHVKCAKEYIIELILQYSTLVAQFAETYLKNDGSGRNTLNSNDFKIPAFYQAWCDNTQGNDQISNWLNSLMAALGGTDEKVSEPA